MPGCARPAFALERLREIDPEHLVYESAKPGPGCSVSLLLTPMQLLERLAALIPPPRRHRHRYIGVLAPNSPLRTAVTALAQPVGEAIVPAAADATSHTGSIPPDETTDEPPPLKPARGPPLWEMQGSESDESDPQAQPAPDYEFDQRVAW